MILSKKSGKRQSKNRRKNNSNPFRSSRSRRKKSSSKKRDDSRRKSDSKKKATFQPGTTYVIVDEFGNVGPSKPHETTFGFGVSVTKHPRLYGAIGVMNRLLHLTTKEKKAKDTSIMYRTITSKAIAGIGTETYAVYVDKKADVPKGWNGKKKREVMIGTLNKTLDETLPEEGEIFVVIDDNNLYTEDKVTRIISSKSDEKREVHGRNYDSEASEYRNQLQTNDFVANVARADVELGESRIANILHMKKKRLGKNDDLKYQR